MVSFGLVIFGLLTGTLLSILVGMFGARRKVGFTLTFLISLVLTPIAGIIVVLLSEKRKGGADYGCFARILSAFGLLSVVLILLIAIIIAAFLAF
ncbi:MAG: hypothetical protein J6Y87_01195 [Muribaculaceae bacterium]|nr:hypothetical protein [Muribaculaceae bacterium]MBP5314465.1 hypothetical protein [Muribaculaceae bacterium]MBR5436410.1 hypothetical protein [Muribaculaceae bacterium]MBR5744199.1 hypothetical protein [Muribaculaceae bacterium]